MAGPDFQTFEAEARAAGFNEVLEKEWGAGVVLDTHRHDFAVSARVVRGEMWLRCGGETRHLVAGDTFTLDARVPHDERYGPEGSTSWIARRHPPKP